MSIVKIKNQSGVTYAYEATSNWDPVKKQSRPIRKYLGRVDEETGEIIPTKGRKGRPKKETPADDYKALYNECEASLKKAEDRIKKLEAEKAELTEANRKLTVVISDIYNSAAPFVK